MRQGGKGPRKRISRGAVRKKAEHKKDVCYGSVSKRSGFEPDTETEKRKELRQRQKNPKRTEKVSS